MVDVVGFVKETVRPYIGNAVALRDRRVQLRGARSLILWTVYVLLLGLLAVWTYQNMRESSSSYSFNGSDPRPVAGTWSVIEAQRRLKEFYDMMLGVLGGVVALIAPIMGASAIVTERQNRLLDLVMSAPVTPRYYLVGKLISSYRYIWMLLLLSLPMVAVGVVLGGSSWWEVAGTYLSISLAGLVLAAIGTAVSASSQKVVGAVVMSLVLGGMWCAFTSGMSAAYTFSRFSMSTDEMPVIGMLSPFNAAGTVTSVSIIAGVRVPNVLLNIPVALALTTLFLLGAACAMQTRHTRIVTAFRALVVVLAAVFGFFVVSTPGFGAAAGFRNSCAFVLMYLPIIPFFSCYAQGDPLKFQYDGQPKIKNTFRAAPSGSLFFALLLPIVFFATEALTLGNQMDVDGWSELAMALSWSLAFCFAVWGLSRFVSRMGSQIRTSQGLTLLVAFLAFFLNLIAGGVLSSMSLQGLSPIVVFDNTEGLFAAKVFWVLFLAALGLIFWVGESSIKKAEWKAA